MNRHDFFLLPDGSIIIYENVSTVSLRRLCTKSLLLTHTGFSYDCPRTSAPRRYHMKCAMAFHTAARYYGVGSKELLWSGLQRVKERPENLIIGWKGKS